MYPATTSYTKWADKMAEEMDLTKYDVPICDTTRYTLKGAQLQATVIQSPNCYSVRIDACYKYTKLGRTGCKKEKLQTINASYFPFEGRLCAVQRKLGKGPLDKETFSLYLTVEALLALCIDKGFCLQVCMFSSRHLPYEVDFEYTDMQSKNKCIDWSYVLQKLSAAARMKSDGQYITLYDKNGVEDKSVGGSHKWLYNKEGMSSSGRNGTEIDVMAVYLKMVREQR